MFSFLILLTIIHVNISQAQTANITVSTITILSKIIICSKDANLANGLSVIITKNTANKVTNNVSKNKQCLMNKQYARMHACEIGDMIQIRDKRLKVIGLIDNSVYSGMIIPYQTMLNVYKEEKDIQFSGTFFCENELQKQKRILTQTINSCSST